MTKVALERLQLQQRIAGQITIGVAGGSGAGKSTIAALLVEALQPVCVEVIGLDRFFKPADELPRYHSDYHGDDCADYNRPDSLLVDKMVAACSVPVDAADVVILDGHLGLCYPQMRQLMDIKCHVDAPLEQMLARRTERNLAANYGGDHDNILHYNRECVVPGFTRYILPARQHADVIIPNASCATAERDAVIQALADRIATAVGGS
jgi:uridine kinase